MLCFATLCFAALLFGLTSSQASAQTEPDLTEPAGSPDADAPASPAADDARHETLSDDEPAPLPQAPASDAAAASVPFATTTPAASAGAATPADDVSPHQEASPQDAAGAAQLQEEAASESASPAASDSFDELLDLPVDVHAFVSQGFLLSTKNNFLARSKGGTLEFTEVGINFTKEISHNLRAGVQIFARDLGDNGNYRPTLDWFYVDWRLQDWLGVRVGRTKIPFGLYNETLDVDAARVPILLPQSVYPNHHRDYLLAVTGGEIYGDVVAGPVGEFEYRIYGGTIFIDTSALNDGPVALTHFSVPYVYGGRLLWRTPLEGLVAAGSLQALRLDGQYQLSPETLDALVAGGALDAGFDGAFDVKIPLRLWLSSLEYSLDDLLLTAEYGRWIGDVESTAPGVIPNSRSVNERFYGMASYRLTSWLTPGVYYSVYYTDVSKRSGREAYTHDAALTLRFDILDNLLFKLEGHVMRGTAALEESPNDDKPLNELAKNWLLLLGKATGYF